jgi:transposase
MNRFPTPQQRASWAGMCPGNNESAGKHFSGRTRKGNRWLRGALGEAAAAAARTKGSYLSARYRVGAKGVTFLARWPAGPRRRRCSMPATGSGN